MLYGYGIADGLDGADQGHEHERRKQRPENRSEIEIEAGPVAGGKSDPFGFDDEGRVVKAISPGDHGARGDAYDRRPEAQRPLGLERDAG